MASSSLNPGSTGTGGTVAGYFANGDDAHRAINDLVEAGFSAREIGAAFHDGGLSRRSSGSGVENVDQAADESRLLTETRADSTVAGAASNTNAVTPMGLSTGGGTTISGAGAPGPIPGSDIPPDLPRDIPSELGSEAGNRTFSSRRAPVADTSRPSARESISTSRVERQEEGWWGKLKHVFGGGEHETSSSREPTSKKDSQSFGTGEGQLNLTSDRDYAYSGSAFESSFSGMGIPQDHARGLARDLRRGGAVVTVRAASKNAIAEAIMQRNHGTIRYESQVAPNESAWDSDHQQTRVEVFGEVHRVYPGYIPEEEVRARKAS
jgi:hypothetical protein